MDALISKETEYKDSIKSIVVEFLKKNEIPHSIIEHDCDGKTYIKLELSLLHKYVLLSSL